MVACSRTLLQERALKVNAHHPACIAQGFQLIIGQIPLIVA